VLSYGQAAAVFGKNENRRFGTGLGPPLPDVYRFVAQSVAQRLVVAVWLLQELAGNCRVLEEAGRFSLGVLLLRTRNIIEDGTE